MFRRWWRTGVGLCWSGFGHGFGRFWEGENHGFGLTPVFAGLLPVFASFGIAKSRRMVEFQFCISTRNSVPQITV